MLRLVFKEGRTVKGSFFFLKFIPNSIRGVRIGASISSKAIPRAVDRSRIRRLVARALSGVVNLAVGGYDVVVAVRNIPHDNNAAALELARAFKRIHI